MNLMIGESHIHYAFDTSLHTTVNRNKKVCRIITDPEGGWKGFSYYNGLMMFSLEGRLENDLKKAGIYIQGYKDKKVVFIFGTSTSIAHKEGRLSPQEYVCRYVDYIEGLCQRYGIRKVYITTPWYVGDDSHSHPGYSARTDKTNVNIIIKQIHDEVTKAADRHPDIAVIPMIDLFNEDGELFNKRYSLDGVHFNELGRQKFFDLITQAIKG